MMAIQKFTPMGETRKFVTSSKYLISEDILEKQEYEFAF